MALSALLALFRKLGYFEAGPLLFCGAALVGVFHKKLCLFDSSLANMGDADALLLWIVFLPLLSFKWAFPDSASRLPLGQALVLGLPGFLLTALLLAGALIFAFGYKASLDWVPALVFGAVAAAVDSVPAANALQNAKCKPALQSLIRGETIASNALSIALFFAFSDSLGKAQFNFSDFFLRLLTVGFGGAGVGLGVGLLSAPLALFFDGPLWVTICTFCAQFLCFFLCEVPALGLGLPGLLAALVCGSFLSAQLKPRLAPQSLAALHTVWSFADKCARCVAFALTGGFFGVYLSDFVFFAEASALDSAQQLSWIDFGMAWGFAALALLLRLGVTLLAWPLLLCAGPKVTWKEWLLVSYSGFKGVSALLILLRAAVSDSFPPRFQGVGLLYMAVLVVFTQLLQALTLKPLAKAVSYDRFQKLRRKAFESSRQKVFFQMQAAKRKIETDFELSHEVDWEVLESLFKFSKPDPEPSALRGEGAHLILDYRNESPLIPPELLGDHEFFESALEEKTQYNFSNIYVPASFRLDGDISLVLENGGLGAAKTGGPEALLGGKCEALTRRRPRAL